MKGVQELWVEHGGEAVFVARTKRSPGQPGPGDDLGKNRIDDAGRCERGESCIWRDRTGFEEGYVSAAQPLGEPRSQRVRRDSPVGWYRGVVVLHSKRIPDRDFASGQRGRDLIERFSRSKSRVPPGDDEPYLVHSEQRQAVSVMIAQLQLRLDRAHRISKGPAAWDDDDGQLGPGDKIEDRVQSPAFSQTAAEL